MGEREILREREKACVKDKLVRTGLSVKRNVMSERAGGEKGKWAFGCGGQSRWGERWSCLSCSPRGKLHPQQKRKGGRRKSKKVRAEPSLGWD